MKTTRPGSVRYPRMYQTFKNSKEIADVINRSTSYVKTALRAGFTDREQRLLNAYAGEDLFDV